MAAETSQHKKPDDKKPSTEKPNDKKPDAEKPEGEQPASKKPKDKLLDPEWVKSQSDEELVDIILEFARELKVRMGQPTDRVAIPDMPPSFEEATVREYTRLPTVPVTKREDEAQTTWRIVLTSFKPKHKPLGLEIYDEVAIGRTVEDVVVDVDLTKHDGEELGVSRRHARLRPTKDSLLLTDLSSTNGTFCNGMKLKRGRYQEVSDGDTISFGGLHFKLKIVSRPGKPPKR